MEDIAMPVQGPLLWVLLIFSIWMLSDAIRRRAGWFWYIVILAAPLGAVIYFVAVKLPNTASRTRESSPAASGTDMQRSGRLRTSLVPNSLDRADELEAADQYDEAIPVYEDALERDPNNLRALHGMARCELGLGQPRSAVERLEKVLSADREFANYGAALDYADALWLAGQRQDTLDVLRGLVTLTGRINHRLALAYYLAESGDQSGAVAEVKRAIEEHVSLPVSEQARQQRWIERAREMLAQWQQS